MPAYAQNLSLQLTPSNYNDYNISCFGGRDGAINLTITGGTPPYSILWSTRDSVEDLSGLASGYYRVEVSDAGPATPVSAEITLTEPEAIRINFTSSAYNVNGREYNISLSGACNGWINTSVTGGVEPYTYHWEQLNGLNQPDVSNLCAMAYFVQVTDANGCLQENIKLMSEPPRDDWTMSGNAGSNSNTNFIGTSDQTDFVFRTSNVERIRLAADGEINIASFTGDGHKIMIADENGNLIPRTITFLDDIEPVPGLSCNDDPETMAWKRKIPANPPAIYTCSDRVGIGNSNPLEWLQLGDKFTFHSGGSKVISANSYWYSNVGTGGTITERRRIDTDPVSMLHFHNNGSIEFRTAPAGGSPHTSIVNDEETRMFISNDGQVGIGTNTPGNGLKLDVTGKGKFSDLLVDALSGNANKLVTVDHAGNLALSSVDVSTASTGGLWNQQGNKIYNTNNGFVGIGTQSPDGLLQVGNSFSRAVISPIPWSEDLNWGTSYLSFNAHRESSGNWTSFTDGTNNGGAVIWGTVFGDLHFATIPISNSPSTNQTGIADAVLKSKTKLKIKNNGNIGIGTDNPQISPWSVNQGSGDPIVLHIEGEYPAIRLNDIVSTGSNDLTSNFEIAAGNGTGRLISNNSIAMFLDADYSTQPDNNAAFYVYKNSHFNGGQAEQVFKVNNTGYVGARGMKLTMNSFPDYVFNDDYSLMSLNELEHFIKTHKRLPEMPSETEVIMDGLDIGDTQILLVKKVEELTLYLFQLRKENELLKERINKLEKN